MYCSCKMSGSRGCGNTSCCARAAASFDRPSLHPSPPGPPSLQILPFFSACRSAQQSAEAPLLSTDPPCVLGVGWHSLGWLSHHDHHDESSHSCFHFPEPADPAKHSPTRNHPSSIGRTIGSHPMRMRSNPDPIPRMHPTTQRTSSSAPTLPHGTWSNNSIYTYMYVYLYKYIYIHKIYYYILYYTYYYIVL